MKRNTHHSIPSHLPLLPAIRKTFSNRNFKYYLISDFTYYMALSIISSGLLYFVTVLLGLPESIGGPLLGVMVIVSLMFYPLINYLSKKIGKKPIVMFSFSACCVSCLFSFTFLGKLPMSSHAQIYFMLLRLASFPLGCIRYIAKCYPC